MGDLDLFLGRLHPLLVHVPIGFFLLFIVLEICSSLAGRRWFHQLPALTKPQRVFILTLCAVTTACTALSGWWLGRGGGYEEILLDRHQLLGLSFTTALLLLLFAQLRGWVQIYRPLLVVTLVLLSAAGHFGGSMTHGEGYLAHYMPALLKGKEPAPAVPVQQAAPREAEADPIVFAGIIHPILEQRCAGCHGPTKHNGDLRLDTWEHLTRGGKSGVPLVAGSSYESLMIQRMHLPLEEKKRMPPKGKPQLTDDEITLLHWWIDSGASTGKRLTELTPAPDIIDILKQRFPIVVADTPVIDRAAILEHAAKLAEQHGLVIRPLTPNEPWIIVSARLQLTAFGDTQLAALAPIAAAIQRLDLGETAVTDAGLVALQGMTNLQRLHLDRTPITDAGLVQIGHLKNLEYLNLYGTKVTDAGMTALRPLNRLRSLYLWQTQVTPEAVATLQTHVVDQLKITRWEAQRAELEKKIAAEALRTDFGARPEPVAIEKLPVVTNAPVAAVAPTAPATSNVPAPATLTAPAAQASTDLPNTICPVSGKPADPAITVVQQGKTTAFCCEDCRKKFLAGAATASVPTL